MFKIMCWLFGCKSDRRKVEGDMVNYYCNRCGRKINLIDGIGRVIKMRKIKFRAWSKRYEFIFPVTKLHFGKMVFGDEPETSYKWGAIILMQFTGLKDKNGKEIFDGYIVEAFYEDEEEYGLVFWNEEIAGFDVEGKKWKSAENLYCSWKYYEVIRNKFENPELLNKLLGIDKKNLIIPLTFPCQWCGISNANSNTSCYKCGQKLECLEKYKVKR